MATPDPSSFPELAISFARGDSADRYCVQYADMLYEKFTAPHPRLEGFGAYEAGASILLLPDSYEQYWDEVGYSARRKVRRALKEGYAHQEIDRNGYLDDIFDINTSMSHRQGREMTESYQTRPDPYGKLPAYTCPRHRLLTFGVVRDGHLYAYTWVYQVGEMCLFSTILGHGDHLNAGIMYLLIAETLQAVVAAAGTRYAMYNMHYSGTEGLRYFKEKVGFQPYRVKWERGDVTAASTATAANDRSE